MRWAKRLNVPDTGLSATRSWWDHVAVEQDDDPERRIAELERLQASASAGRTVEQPVPYPQAPQPGWPQQSVGQSAPPMPAPSQSGSLRPRGRFRAVLSTIVIGVMAIGFTALAGHSLYAYAVGTATTAKVASCHYSGKSWTCMGTWTINGTPQTGPIDGNGKSYHVASTVDVRVHDGTAYTTASVSGWAWPAALFVGFGALSLFLRIRKRRRFR